MHAQPAPSWYLYNADSKLVRLLADDGHANPALYAHADLAALAAAIHALAWRLSEHELRHVEQFLAMQRWGR